MLATDGYFTFVASQPQLACAAFVIAEPSDVISLELYDVSIDCGAGDFIKVDVTHLKKNRNAPTPPLQEVEDREFKAIQTLNSMSSYFPFELKCCRAGLTLDPLCIGHITQSKCGKTRL